MTVCTHQRASSTLRPCLESLVRRFARGGLDEARVLLVADACTDGSAELASRILGEGGVEHEVMEGEWRSLSRARNAALDHAVEGGYEWILYIDDDALAGEGWPMRLVSRLEEAGAAFGGGEVLPRWPEGIHSPPPWLTGSPYLMAYLSLLRLDDDLPCSSSGVTLVGANCAWRASELADAGGFPVLLGRKGASLLSNEEYLAMRRLERRGCSGLLVKGAPVYHLVPRERLARRWFLRRAWWQGVSDAMTARLEGRSKRRTLQALGRLGLVGARAVWQALRGDDGWFSSLCMWWHELAFMRTLPLVVWSGVDGG